ncbi:hypothetical protein [Mycobacterium shimoidei]|nr:hypothetical protein [Mycobacterium shimoidei]MCV7258592.1 hypothetical protein [Mycobacterium shimoidei]
MRVAILGPKSISIPRRGIRYRGGMAVTGDIGAARQAEIDPMTKFLEAR